ncbi:hypothetical protein I4U23_016318 [Adineta vaga]|nr:hypothetical protein I4U23_016318 [Adineta vaga]
MQCITLVLRKIKNVAEWNAFKDAACRTDPFHLRTAIISTRVYVALLSISVIIIATFTFLDSQAQVNTIRNPSQATYEALFDKNATSLSCPCRRATVPYGNFTWTIVDYHPVCSSVFVSDDWINDLFSPDVGSFYQGDFRSSASNLFQVLASFCSHAKRSVHDALADFHSEILLTTDVLSSDSLKDKVKAKSDFVQKSGSLMSTQVYACVNH